MALLNSRQQYMAEKMATMTIRESSDLDGSTEEEFVLDHENKFDFKYHNRNFEFSTSNIERRLLDAYQVKRWKEDYKRHKGKHAPFKS